MSRSLIANTAKSDFIATAKVLKVSEDTVNMRYLNIEIEILELFKGPKIQTLKLYNNSPSSCGLFTPEYTSWLIFASKNKQGVLSFGYCSGSEQLDKKFNPKIYTPEEQVKAKAHHDEALDFKLEVLRYLRINNINPVNKYNLNTFFISDCLKELKEFVVNNEPFAFYELTVEKDLKVSQIRSIKAFDNEELNLKLRHCIREGITMWKSATEKSIPEPTNVILGIYYNVKKDGSSRFIAKKYL